MKRIEGTAGVKLIECTHPAKNKWRIRWDVQEREDGSATYMEKEFKHKPTDDEIKQTVIGWINAQTDEAILSGFEWNGMPVWLSSENQFNYKAAYDLAVQTAGATLPVKFKFGTDDVPCYHTFQTIEELTDFYMKSIQYIQKMLDECWDRKDAFNLDSYQE